MLSRRLHRLYGQVAQAVWLKTDNSAQLRLCSELGNSFLKTGFLELELVCTVGLHISYTSFIVALSEGRSLVY